MHCIDVKILHEINITQERSILLRMYMNLEGYQWKSKENWIGAGDHCKWEGVTCGEDETKHEYRVIELSLPDNQLIGDFPADLNELNVLKKLSITGNSMVKSIPENLCSRSASEELQIFGDHANCPNSFDASIGEYSDSGCCSNVLVDVDTYLENFARYI